MVRSLSASLHLSDFPIDTSLHLLSHVYLTIFRELSSDLVQNTMSQQYEWPRHAMVGPLWLLWHMAPDESSFWMPTSTANCCVYHVQSFYIKVADWMPYSCWDLAHHWHLTNSNCGGIWCDAPCHGCCLVIAVRSCVHFVLRTCVSKFDALWASK